MQQTAEIQAITGNEGFPLIVVPKKRIAGVLLDADGTLYDSEELHYHENRIYFGQFGVEITPQMHIDYWISGTRGSQGIIEDFRLPVKLEDVWRDKQEIYIEQLMPGLKAREGVLEYLDYVRTKGALVAVVTTNYRESTEASLRQIGVYEIMPPNMIIAKEDVLHHKPYPEPYIEGAKLLGIEPGQCIGVEDTYKGFQSMYSAGIGFKVIFLYNWTEGGWKNFNMGHIGVDRTVKRLDELIELDLL